VVGFTIYSSICLVELKNATGSSVFYPVPSTDCHQMLIFKETALVGMSFAATLPFAVQMLHCEVCLNVT
jgi:hypothetical protein